MISFTEQSTMTSLVGALSACNLPSDQVDGGVEAILKGDYQLVNIHIETHGEECGRRLNRFSRTLREQSPEELTIMSKELPDGGLVLDFQIAASVAKEAFRRVTGQQRLAV